MKKEVLIAIVDGILGNDDLCKGCAKEKSPYSSANGGSCQECCRKAADEIIKIIKNSS